MSDAPLHPLLPLLEALDASPSALRKDDCGDYRIDGRWGHIYWRDRTHFHVFVLNEKAETGAFDHWKTTYGWTRCKMALSFLTVINDGDMEGSFFLDRMPTPEEANAIRNYCGIRKKVHYSEEVLAKKREIARTAMAGMGRKPATG